MSPKKAELLLKALREKGEIKLMDLEDDDDLIEQRKRLIRVRKALRNGLKNTMNAGVEGIKATMIPATEGLKNTMNAGVDGVKATMIPVNEGLKNTFIVGKDAAGNTLTAAHKGLKTTVQTGLNEADKVVEASIAEQLEDLGYDVYLF